MDHVRVHYVIPTSYFFLFSCNEYPAAAATQLMRERKQACKEHMVKIALNLQDFLKIEGWIKLATTANYETFHF